MYVSRHKEAFYYAKFLIIFMIYVHVKSHMYMENKNSKTDIVTRYRSVYKITSYKVHISAYNLRLPNVRWNVTISLAAYYNVAVCWWLRLDTSAAGSHSSGRRNYICELCFHLQSDVCWARFLLVMIIIHFLFLWCSPF